VSGEPGEGTRPYYFPNKMARIVLLATEETVGRNGMAAILNLARLPHLIGNFPPPDFENGLSFEEMAGLLAALDEMYGPRAGRGLALRAGRACFKYGIQDFGGLLGVADFAFRFLPFSLKVRIGFEVLAEVFNRYSDQHVTLGEDKTSYFWVIDRCGFCQGRHTQQPACSLVVGLLEESLYWVSGGKHFEVEEVTCMATGDPTCTIIVSRQALD